MRRRPRKPPAAFDELPAWVSVCYVEDWVDLLEEQPPSYWGDAASWYMLQAWRRWQAARGQWRHRHGLTTVDMPPVSRPVWRDPHFRDVWTKMRVMS